MDTSLSNFELTSSTGKATGSDSDPSSERSDNFIEVIVDSDSSSNSTSTDIKLDIEYFDKHLPETVTLLEHRANGTKVYLVGTAHFSKESQEDVAKVIRNVHPHVVVLELCSSRTSILSLDENTVLEEAKNIDMDKIITTIKTNGLYNGIYYLLLLNMSAHLTKQIGMAPGGEFRVAYKEAIKLQNCSIHLGDRPINITLQRALSKLTWFQTFKLAWHLLTSRDPVSVEEIEKCKKRDMLEQLLADLAGEYPAFGEVFLDERDIYLTHSLQSAALHSKPPGGGDMLSEPLRIVGVVGIGHVAGIAKLWPEDQRPYVEGILIVPPPTLTSKLIKYTFKVSILTLGGYLVYRFVPVPKVFKESCQVVVKKVIATISQR